MSEASPTLSGLRVAAFESRLAGPLSDLIAKYGGDPVSAPALREVPLDASSEALAFGSRLMKGEIDVVIFLTGVGARYLAETIETVTPRAEWLAALSRTKVVVRGPKPLAVMREFKARVDVQVPEPNTFHEILAALDRELPVANLRVAVQEYGEPNVELVRGLETRGATVATVRVYRWALPEDTAPLRRAAHALAGGAIDMVLFTSAQQVVHLFEIAAAEGVESAVRSALHTKVVVCSIGPTTSEVLRARALPVDIEPAHPKMGHLVVAAATRWREVGKVSRQPSQDNGPDTVNIEPVSEAAGRADAAARLWNSRFLRACRREPTDVTPIWLMRQAGRYMPEYRELRTKVGFLELCKRPDLAAEVTVSAAQRLGVDAAILFADILLVLEPLGFNLEFSRGEGPVIHNPIRAAGDVDRVRPLADPAPLGFVYEALRAARAALPPDLPLIGFAGAPFTVACYAIEGSGSRHYDKAKSFMYSDAGAWNSFLAILSDSTADYLTAQVAAGAQALQLFDSWVGSLSPDDYRRFVQPHMRRLIAALPAGVPVIHFGTDTGSLLELQRDAGGSVIGVDWRVELDRAWERLGPGVAVQGNLDPAVLLGPRSEIEHQVQQILDRAAGKPGHIFNLGHGILPQTPVESVKALVDIVHDIGQPAQHVRGALQAGVWL
jgi:uroporphyrinogen decarboxylase